jgi:hypothetical protein
LVSASHCSRPRIGLLDRVTCASTRGGSYRPPGIVPSQPPGPGISVPVQGPSRPFDPRFGEDRTPPWSLRRRSAFGRTVVGRVDGAPRPPSPSGETGRPASLGAGACRPSSAPRHGDPGSPSGLGRTQDRDLRVVTPGPASAEPTVGLRPIHRTRPKRPSALERSGFGR